MKLIVGLGNPGKEYEGTRHNVGFMFLDALAADNRLAPADKVLNFTLDKKFDAKIASTLINGEKILLIKPQTFMNRSGNAVKLVMNYYDTTVDDLIVISDDIDLPVGKIRVRNEGSSGGHKGLQSIIDQIKNEEFTRIRIGVLSDLEKKNQIESKEYVLEKFSDREYPLIERVIEEAIYYLMPYLGSKDLVPAHSMDIVVDSLK